MQFFLLYYDFSYFITIINNMKASSAVWKHKLNSSTSINTSMGINRINRTLYRPLWSHTPGSGSYHSLQAAGGSRSLFHLISLPSPADRRVHLRRGRTSCATLSFLTFARPCASGPPRGITAKIIFSRPECWEPQLTVCVLNCRAHSGSTHCGLCLRIKTVCFDWTITESCICFGSSAYRSRA